MTISVWDELKMTLLHLYSLSHNRIAFRNEPGWTPEAAVKKTLGEIQSGIGNVPVKKDFTGPKLFLRVVGPANFAYSGQWWFEASLLDTLERAYSRIYFQTADRRTSIRDMLRELLAVTTEWNAMTEVWALELPPGERIVGYSGIGNPQRLFGGLPLTDKANRMLVGRAKQIFFPVKNPLWVKLYRQLTP